MKKLVLAILLFSVFGAAGHLHAQAPVPYAYLLVSTDLDVKISVNGAAEHLAPAGGAITRVPLERGDNIVRVAPADGGPDGYTEIVRLEQPENKALLLELGEKRKVAVQAAAARKTVIDKQNEEVKQVQSRFKSIHDAMVLVEGGTFAMGSPDGRWGQEKPIRAVTLSNFHISKYEVTQKQWWDVMGNNPTGFSICDDCPVENVSWEDIQTFLTKLNEACLDMNYRLPTEAEWEYAARGGKKSKGFTYAGGNKLESVAWSYRYYKKRRTHPVGKKKPNELGLYDMSGNVSEWCSDWYGAYPATPETNPKGPSSGKSRVIRGGAYKTEEHRNYDPEEYYHVSHRDGDAPSGRSNYIGFRLARPF